MTTNETKTTCFLADAPGTFGANDGRVWRSFASLDEGRKALYAARKRGEKVVLRHGALQPGTWWRADPTLDVVYPEVK